MTQSKTFAQRIDALREEFQDQRPDVVMVVDDLYDLSRQLEETIKIMLNNAVDKFQKGERR